MLVVKQNKPQINKIRKKIAKQNSIFSEKRYLDGLYLPSKIIKREKQTEELLYHIDNIRQGFSVPLISVCGRSGSGKSTIVKSVCDNVENLACFVYVNLRKANTIFGCMNLILSQFDVSSLKNAEGTNKAINILTKSISEKLVSQRKKFMILVLDEYDVIFLDKRNHPSDFIYKLLVIAEELREKDQWLCIITISNDALSDNVIDDRVKSRIGFSDIFFPSYTVDEITEILSDRAKKAFAIKIPYQIIQHCAKTCSMQYGDARRALELLRISGELSEGVTITKQNIDDASGKLQKDNLKVILENLSYHQTVVLGGICDNVMNSKNGLTSTFQIFETYKPMVNNGIKPVSYSRLRDFLVDLKNSGLIESKTLSRGRGGYGTLYTLCFPPELIGPHIGAKWWEDVLHRNASLDAIAEYHKIHKSEIKSSLRSYLKNHGL